MRRASALLAALLALTPAAFAQKVATNALASPVLVSTTLSTTVVYLSWTPIGGATGYDLYRKTGGAPFTKLLSSGSTTHIDSVPAGTTHYYQVVAKNNTETAASNVDLATTVAFTDDPVQLGVTPIRAGHVTQLRTAVNAARAAAGRPLATWTNANLAQAPVRTEDVEELRAALNDARGAAGMVAALFSDAPLVKNSTTIRKTHLKELRQAVKGVQPGGLLTVTNIAVSESFFSPNGDAVKEVTALTAKVSSTDGAWSVSVRSSAGAVLRTASGAGTNVSYVWDGRDGAGSVVPDGTYTFAIQAVDGVYSASSGASTVVDRTAPTATLTAPTEGQTWSNVLQNGQTNVTASGTASDTNFASWDVAHGTGSSMTTFASGQSAVSNAQFGVWSSGASANGTYTVRLQVRDKAGNVGTASVGVTVAHFSASQNVHQIRTSTGEQIVYTSNVPFTATETLTIRNGAGATVRTLVNASRAAGTYNDTWNGRNDAGTLLPDGPYSYTATVTQGASSFTWNTSTQMVGSSATQYPYPSCSGQTMPLDTCQSHGLAGKQYDPYTNDPLKIHYSVAEPSRVSVLLSTMAETPASCGGGVLCVTNQEYRAAGDHVETWSGVTSSGLYDTAPRPYVTVVRRTDTFPKNVVLLYGSGAPVLVKNLVVTPPLYSPEGGAMKVEFDLETFGNATANVTIEMVRQPDSVGMSTLYSTTLNNQSPGRITYSWDGKAVSGHWTAAGEYALVVRATSGGFTSTTTARFVLIY